MNILICPDSFKGSLSAIDVAKIIGDEFSKENHNCTLMPIADGGEGTVETLLFELGGDKKEITVHGPLGNSIKAFYGLSQGIAFIEMAESSGLHCISEEEKNPWITTTYGLGEIMKDALDQGVEEMYIGIGGSATNDVGIGMAQALGIKFLDENGNEIEERKEEGYGASVLSKVHSINTDGLDERIQNVKIKVFCDVQNPLFGEHGASYTYAPQKGADDELIKKLEKGVKHFAQILENTYNQNPNFAGAGAAGGLGAALKLFLGAGVVSGIEGMIQLLQLEEKIQHSDVVVVGEGQMDYQSMFGKAPIGIAKIAKKHNKQVIAMVGKVGKDVENTFEYIDHIFSCYGKEEINFQEVKKKSRENLMNLSKKALTIIQNIHSFKYQLTLLT